LPRRTDVGNWNGSCCHCGQNISGEIKTFHLLQCLFILRPICRVFVLSEWLRPCIGIRGNAIAQAVIESLDVCGLLAVVPNLWWWLADEVAPRPHNSGHHTIECCNVSQFQQHLLICNLPLIDPYFPSWGWSIFGEEIRACQYLGEKHCD
jgi:phosphoribosylaminoimidazole carboxylase (NCAIR synthetase)